MFKKLLKYAMKYPMKYPLITKIIIVVVGIYFCSNVFKTGNILKPEGVDEKRKTNPGPDSDDISMFIPSQVHTEKVAEKDSKKEDLINASHS